MTAGWVRKFVVSAVLLLLGLAVALIFLFGRLTAPASPTSRMVAVEIKAGMRTSKIAAALEEKGAIRSRLAFTILAKLTGKSDKLKAGEYEIDASNDAAVILERIATGKSVLHQITVPEGLTLVQTARLLASRGICDEASVLGAARKPALLAAFGIPGRDAEGYLMPETYAFRKDAPADEVVRKMIALFFARTKPLADKYQPSSKMSLHSVVTLASIIEKEGAGPEEFRTISAVFHNRLRLNMPLQADPTVIYANPNYDGNIHKKDLSLDSPYNTYKYRGLPPGPIANPSLRAIEAAYDPLEADYLYFVAMGTGMGHHFSTTLEEHNKAVRKYVLDPA
ncbi:MAG: endolytic transglycosylase MltG [Nitrospinae bacterium]|nr:endolytic transglycosylase MltG [Nitrospinota bacterium]